MPQAEQPAVGHPRPRRIGAVVMALTAGLVGGLLTPLVYPAMARGARPAAKRALKVGFAAVERGRVAAAELAEHTSDLLAEARSEYEQEQKLGADSAQAVDACDMPMDVVDLPDAIRGAAGN